MLVSEIELYELLKAKIGDKEAGAFIQILEKRVDKKFDESKLLLASKQDIADAKVEIMRWMFGVFVVLALMIVCLYFK
jgi:hypothetical protein